MGWLCLISQPLVITFSVGFWILYNRQSIFNADRITQLPNRFGTAPKVTELPVTVRINRRPDDVIMDMGFINMRADHKGVITLVNRLANSTPNRLASSGVISPGLKDWRT